MDVGAERLITSWVAEACTRLAFTLNSSHVANSAKEYLPIHRSSGVAKIASGNAANAER